MNRGREARRLGHVRKNTESNLAGEYVGAGTPEPGRGGWIWRSGHKVEACR